MRSHPVIVHVLAVGALFGGALFGVLPWALAAGLNTPHDGAIGVGVGAPIASPPVYRAQIPRALLAQERPSEPAPTAPAPAVPAAPAGVAPGDKEADALAAEMEKRWGEAERLYRELLAGDPNRADLLMRLADVLAAAGKPLEAAGALGRAADLRRDDADLQQRASAAYAAADRPAEALRYIDRALAGRPRDLDLHERRVRLANWAGDYTKAEASLRVLLAARPNEAALKRDLSRVLGWQKRPREAAAVLSEFLAQNPNDKEALLDLATLETELGNSARAAELLQRYREAGGEERIYERAVAELPMQSAMKAEADKRWEDAERIYREMLEKEPNRVDVLRRLADVLAVAGKGRDAATALARAADQQSDDVDAQLRASQALAAANQPVAALKYADRALALRPGDLELHQRRQKLAVWAGRYKEAEESLRALIAADPKDVSLNRDLGRVLSWQGRYRDAAEQLAKFLAQYPDDRDALIELARIEAMRGRQTEAAALLKRYREAGGDEATYRRELQLLQRQKPGGAAAPSRAAPTATAPSNVPAAALAAEGQKRWADAERIYRGVLAREPGRIDLWRRLVDVLAVQGKRREAAQALAMIADLRAQDAEAQLRASEAFAAADLPAEALRFVNRALALRPGDIELHRRRAVLASWAGNNREAEESLRAILAAEPHDLTAKRDLGRVLGWQGRADQAVRLLSEYLAERPDDKDALLALAGNQAARGNSAAAVAALQRYREAGGSEITYRRELALVLAWAGRSRGALALAQEGLATDPSDYQLLFARAVALRDGYEYGLARADIERLVQLRPGAKEIGDLRRTVDIAERPFLQLDTLLRHESDDVITFGSEISYFHPVNEAWALTAGGTADYLRARSYSVFAPIDGGVSESRGGGWVGGQTRFAYGALASGRIGVTSAGKGGPRTTWRVALDDRLSDELRLQLANRRDVQVVSPRSLSLGITRIDTIGQATWTPDLRWTVVGLLQEAELSDGNRLVRASVAPRRAVVRAEDWNLDLGVSGNWYGYRFDAVQNGYYSPGFFQQYLLTAFTYYKISDEDGVSLIMSFGALRDDTMTSFKFSHNYYLEATFGQFSDWMWKVRAGYTNNGSATGANFSAEQIGLTVVRRF